MTPDDQMVFANGRTKKTKAFGYPQLWRPQADEVHVSVTFTWDIEEGYRLRDAWAQYYADVRIGGPAFDACPNGFVPGRYLRHGVTFTTRGCNNKCPWCLVPRREGKLVEFDDFAPGNIIQDNNILQASHAHLERVGQMLKAQRRAAVFSGGIQSNLVNDWVAEWMRGLRIKEVFLAADTFGSLPALRRAVDKLKFLKPSSDKLRCYVLIGRDGETISEATDRLEAVWDAGCMPFAQLYQPDTHFIEYSKEWKALNRTWSRPAAMRSMHKEAG